VIGINNSDEYAFTATLTISSSVNSLNDAGIWAARHGNPQTLVHRESDHAPGTNAAVGFSAFSGLRMNSEGRVAFSANLSGISGAGESGITTLNDTGIWSEGISGALQLVAREDDHAPGTEGDTLFSLFAEPALNAAGQTAFTAELRGPTITTANNLGLWAQDSSGELQLIVRRGDPLDVDPSPEVDERIVQNIAFWSDGGGEDGRRTGLNRHGQIAFAASFTDGSSGIFVSDMVANAMAGDFDNDGDVDGRDFLAWQRNPSVGNLSDWQNNYGFGSLTVAATAVPEPATIGLLLVAGIASACRRRAVC
jgi:hypothetical protein